jgi:acetolactate synthase small subunit
METATPTATAAAASYLFVIKLTDHPGGMELIAATFASRGVSLMSSVGNDGGLDPTGRATVVVTFSAPPAKKEIIRRALTRLSRVTSLAEHPMNSHSLRKTAVFRMDGYGAVEHRMASILERIAHNETTGEITYMLVDTPAKVDSVIKDLRATNRLRDVATSVIGL